MKMTPGRRALDKIYKRRDRYEIPDWQRNEVWDTPRKQALIDSILRGWKLPKLYFLKTGSDTNEVVDGQQRLVAIYEFFGDELALSSESAERFGAALYSNLPTTVSDTFDDFELEFDEIEDASSEEIKEFFTRLQMGLSLSSSEKLNSIESKLRDFCRKLVDLPFFCKSVAIANTRFAHFDIISKVAALEIEGMDAGLRYDEIRKVFQSQKLFSSASAVAKRLKGALDFLAEAFPEREAQLKNRSVVQSVVTLACHLVATKKSSGLEKRLAKFVRHFLAELSKQVELGANATDRDYLRFQRTVSANVKSGAKIRDEILLRKAFTFDPILADAFDPSVLIQSGIRGRVRELASEIAGHVERLNTIYASVHGEDLFKSTNKTAGAFTRIGKAIDDRDGYIKLMSELYFLFKEGPGTRLDDHIPPSFSHVNALRVAQQHDLDHGAAQKVKKKIAATAAIFETYAGSKSPELLDPARFVVVQANLLTAIELDLKNLVIA